MASSPFSAFIVNVPEAEPCVADLRQRYDGAAKRGMGAHISILVPFMPPEQIDDTVLEAAGAYFATVQPFDFTLSRIARFPAVTWLAPEPAQPFIDMTLGLAQCFPEYAPYSGLFDRITPHLTVAKRNKEGVEIAERELVGIMQTHGPICSRCDSVALLENASGMWREIRVFRLKNQYT
ncbi:MAG TPA: 2'-5' RNA ligase family protein [Rhodocyclaceae bacterium]|jgi:2'-5' RNA ligase|nr:2'-5' RNA ligase family protein [Rhodocyclaceae bacterium]